MERRRKCSNNPTITNFQVLFSFFFMFFKWHNMDYGVSHGVPPYRTSASSCPWKKNHNFQSNVCFTLTKWHCTHGAYRYQNSRKRRRRRGQALNFQMTKAFNAQSRDKRRQLDLFTQWWWPLIAGLKRSKACENSHVAQWPRYGSAFPPETQKLCASWMIL